MNDNEAADQGRPTMVARPGEAEPAPIRVVIVDDHTLVREGTIQLFEQAPEVEVVGQAGSGEEGWEVIERVRPNVALVDVHLPRMTGLDLAKAVVASLPDVRVLIVSAYDDYAYLAEALEIGAAGYLLKTATGRELMDAVRAAAAGVFVLDQQLSRRLARRRTDPASGSTLTRRENEVLAVLARGRSNQQIAAELGLGQRTVEGHVSSVLAKLGVASRAEAVAYALGHHLVVQEERHGDPTHESG